MIRGFHVLTIIKNHWSQATVFSRFVLTFAVAFIFLGLLAASFWVMREDYQILFSELNPQDASSMVSELERMKVPYKLADDGATILVEKDAVYKTRLKLMGKGLNLQGSVGFEIFNNSEFGMTEFAQKVNYQRALQGELARTIMGFEEIKSARVHLVMPESGLFKRQSAKPKASVSVVVRDDEGLSKGQISGIQRLVAASVPEIDPTEVTVIDQRGVAVSKQFIAEDNNGSVQDRLDIKKQLEEYMTRKIVSVVDKVVGPGKAIVSVDATLNYDQVKIVKEDVVPLPNTIGQEIGAITKRKETVQSGGSWSGETYKSSNSGPAASTLEVEYSNSRRVEQVLSSPGNILRLSVGVLLPDISDQVKIAKLKELVSMAAGIDPSRGDGLAVYGVELPVVANESPVAIPAPSMATTPLAQPQQADSFSASQLSFSTSQWSYFLMGLVIAGIFMTLHTRRRSTSMARLKEDERAQLLEEVSQWTQTREI